MQFEGLYPPVITPYASDYSIDREGFANIVEHLATSGVHGLIIGGTTGEYYAQSADERVELMRFAKELLNGRLPLIAGVGAVRTEEAVDFAAKAREIGADALILNAPAYAVPDPAELAGHALAVDTAANLPIVLYNFPGRTGTMMSAEFLDRVGRKSNFVAIKESSGDINQLHMLANDYPHITLLCGMDDQALEFYAWGARSWVCAGSNFAPEAHIALHKACVTDGDFSKGRRIMSAMLPLLAVLEQGGKFVQCIKHGLTLRGIEAGPPRRPLYPLNKDEKRALAEVVSTMNAALAKIEREA